MPTATLYLVATPIGNLADMVPRAVTVLQSVDAIAVEDSRHSGKLLQHFNISKPLIPYHDHNERDAAERILQLLQQHKSVALISDAGTPAIADPGYRLVRLAHQHGVRVESVPGPCAAIAALAGSGLPSDRFQFCGFLPAKQQARCNTLQTLAQESATLIFYEAPHRLADTAADMAAVFGGEREICLARELTKHYETLWLTTLDALVQALADKQVEARGEIVLVVAGCKDRVIDAVAGEDVLKILLDELPLKQAAALAAKITGTPKRELYQHALALKGERDA
ncbi:MAG: 16S rRNA (cytidine(1402)-2'-O)-methyltransferase [Pseudomonadales bacterium]|nr:16S rRNA (cytidine(1402)-2'-O)-methyltransferase [Pseudomonadales bacterium]